MGLYKTCARQWRHEQELNVFTNSYPQSVLHCARGGSINHVSSVFCFETFCCIGSEEEDHVILTLHLISVITNNDDKPLIWTLCTPTKTLNGPAPLKVFCFSLLPVIIDLMPVIIADLQVQRSATCYELVEQLFPHKGLVCVWEGGRTTNTESKSI